MAPLRPSLTFDGFKQATFAFLKGLAEAQTREWFIAHRPDYEAHALEPMRSLLATLSDELARRKLPFRAASARSVFRIHRGVRFSNDKRPYKTHIGASLSRNGEKLSPGLLYIHIDPEGSFAAAGFYRPAPDPLGAIREAIAVEPKPFAATLKKLAAAGLALSPDEDALKRTPRGFEHVTDPALQDALRRKSWIVRRKLTRADVGRADLAVAIADFAQAAEPLLAFGWTAIDAAR